MPSTRPILVRAFDAAFSPRNIHRVERLVIAVAFGGFLVHVALIALHRWWPDAPVLVERVGSSYLAAVYTPFSFILFYEVLLLVAAFAESTSRQMALQYQIVSLIVIRRVFKDFGDFEEPAGVAEHAEVLSVLAIDLGGSALLVLLTAIFHWVRRRAHEAVPEADLGLERFKKSLALFLGVVLIVLAFWNLGHWVWTVYLEEMHGVPTDLDVDAIFYDDFFTLLILVDVLVLVRSWRLLPTYAALIQNAGFVISTILIRLSITSAKPYHLLLAAFGIGFGIAILGITTLLRRATGDPEGLTPHAEEAAASG